MSSGLTLVTGTLSRLGDAGPPSVRWVAATSCEAAGVPARNGAGPLELVSGTMPPYWTAHCRLLEVMMSMRRVN